MTTNQIALDVPAFMTKIVQTNFLQRRFEDKLLPQTAYRRFATREPLAMEAGETTTKTRRGLIAPSIVALAPGVDPESSTTYQIEQWMVSPKPYGKGLDTHLPSARIAIINKFWEDCDALADHAGWTMERLARNGLYVAYAGGDTLTTAVAAGAATALVVASLAGFRYALDAGNKLVPVSGGNPLTVSVDGVANTVTAAVPADADYPNGPGTLTIGTALGGGGLAARKAVKSALRPTISRPSGVTDVDSITATSLLSVAQINAAVRTMRKNRVPTLPDGTYPCLLDPSHEESLLNDAAFRQLYQGAPESPEFRNGRVMKQYGVTFISHNDNPDASNNSHTTTAGGGSLVQMPEAGIEVVNANGIAIVRSMLLGANALTEGYVNEMEYAATMAGAAAAPYGYQGEFQRGGAFQTELGGVRYILAPPTDRKMEKWRQTWSATVDFVPPTDATANWSSALYKRGIVFETA